MSVTQSPAWKALHLHRDELAARSLGDIVLSEKDRLDHYSATCGGVRFSYAFQKVTQKTIRLLCDLAVAQKVEEWRTRMFAGDKINVSEKRAVLHTALRRKDGSPLFVDGADIMLDIRATRKRIVDFVNSVRTAKWRGATGKPIRSIVNIGIGGSDLGPRMAALALQPFIDAIDLHFVANVDAFDLQNVLRKVKAEETLFIIASKTFATVETLLNAQSARQWLVGELGEAAVAKHFVAVSVNARAVEDFGIDTANMFPMWEWVGGRFSVWSAVGLALALAIGNEQFDAFLAGAEAMDTHFRTTPLAMNLPAMLALIGIWNRNFLGMPAHVMLPYCERLREMPRYLQQLEMESNGKSVTRDGERVDYDTVPALFGECGTIGQHSFHQWLHQGSTVLSADFIGINEDASKSPEHHRILMMNMAAQMGALAFGQTKADKSYDVYQGGRPSSLLLLNKLDPYHLGMLLALYEHKVFVQGIIWNINSFDQPGVELGKRLARGLEAPVAVGSSPTAAVIEKLYKTTQK